MLKYQVDHRLEELDGRFFIANADYTVFSRMMNVFENRKLKAVAAKTQYPKVRNQLKFYIEPESANKTGSSTPLLDGSTLSKRPNAIRVRLISDEALQLMNDRLKSFGRNDHASRHHIHREKRQEQPQSGDYFERGRDHIEYLEDTGSHGPEDNDASTVSIEDLVYPDDHHLLESKHLTELSGAEVFDMTACGSRHEEWLQPHER